MSIETFSTGSELLNLVVGGGWPQGSLINIQGDTSSGKTLLCLEAAANHLLKWPKSKIGLTEREPSFNMDYVTSLGIPTDKIDFWQELYTIEDWFNAAEAFKDSLEDQPGLLILDSLDSLSDDAEMDRGISDASYGGNKAKKISEIMRRLAGEFEEKKITTIIVSQLRDVLNSRVPVKKASGGHAVPFYSGVVIKLNEAYPNAKIMRQVSGIQRIIGLNVRAKCTKNKVGLPFRECNMKIMFGYGIDDIASNLYWLESVDQGLDKIRPIGNVSLAETEEEKKAKKAAKKAAKAAAKAAKAAGLVLEEEESEKDSDTSKGIAFFMKKLSELPREEI